ncbi:hypothetical protein B0T16DRAFT_140155 [Cercophora newfieldiana]|uniref:Uncharacterized protein n=1 Tax=Cercophora newfieldiana TaxID=92897 RepID=A0AA39Y3Q3_9PEZI|nr:hypothetical protein B0T16DRAFT_140155 [Cercophora newfieldiana]
MNPITNNRSLPKEMIYKIWEEAIPLPGIHFFEMDNKKNLRASEPAILPVGGNRALLPPRPRAENDPNWWFPSKDANPRASFFSGGNPSAYATHANLLDLSEESAREVNRIVSRKTEPKDWFCMQPSTAGSPTPSTREADLFLEEGKIKMHLTTDIVCIQIPNRMSHREFFGLRVTSYGLRFLADAFPAFETVKAMVVEWRPRMRDVGVTATWDEDWKVESEDCDLADGVEAMDLDDADDDSDDDDDVLWNPHRFDSSPDKISIMTHFAAGEFKTLYFLDYALRLKEGMKPSESAKRWRGGMHDFVEVFEEDQCWEKEKDGFPGVVVDFDPAAAVAEVLASHCMCDDTMGGLKVMMMARVAC